MSRNNCNINGIDVSNWSGSIDFSQVAQTDAKIVYIQATEGTYYTDPYLHEFYNGAKANGFKVGFYHYFNPGSSPTPREQARYFVDALKGFKIDCRLALDLEETGGLNNEELTNQAIEFLEAVKEFSGLDVVVYTYTNFAQTSLNTNSDIGKYKLWIAEYSSNYPQQNPVWGEKYIGWQYSDSGDVRGVGANTDLDYFSSEILLEHKEDTEHKPTDPEKKTENKPDKKPHHKPSEDTHHKTENPKIIDYIVKPGDTLSQIAQNYNTTVNALVQDNNIQNPNLIYPGQVIKIYTNSKPFSHANSLVIDYIVKPGDTLSQIAQNYNTTVNVLAQANNIQNPDLIYPGQVIKIYKASNDYHSNPVYIVRPGDILSQIALNYNTTVNELVHLNNIQNPNLIYPGQIIKLP